jgi:hypothetical protein
LDFTHQLQLGGFWPHLGALIEQVFPSVAMLQKWPESCWRRWRPGSALSSLGNGYSPLVHL